MSPDTMPNYDVWRCHDPREDEDDELNGVQEERLSEIIVDKQNEAVLDHGWDLMDEIERDEALLYLKQHQAQFEEQALSQLREEIKKEREAARDPF